MESHRQKKIAGVIQKDLADILQRAINDSGLRGTLISVTKVKVTVDLSIAKVYLSIFPNTNNKEILADIRVIQPKVKHELSQRTKNQLRRIPELEFFIDDSLEYIDQIDRSLKGEDNPLQNPDLLEQRKKS
ncbi:30S ribosome-binding factor RbfA [Zhouia spongiae]|uniref:Ribosome-binding factor A n=1 Tax=Zhouia spongiae TaxID=2202721 RepID=A0ABY3YPJ0_9FLAO|nr:30S ribosome-binding factor RbfA [Zhouia spongiae]UNY99757.1 30S ribosome-binding factor RbfA [Zhouia spongiae]